jgi:hypothetical protein
MTAGINSRIAISDFISKVTRAKRADGMAQSACLATITQKTIGIIKYHWPGTGGSRL